MSSTGALPGTWEVHVTLQALQAQALAAFGAACVDNSAATLGLHADEETVGTGAADFGRLVSTFHDAIPREAWFRFGGNRAAHPHPEEMGGATVTKLKPCSSATPVK